MAWEEEIRLVRLAKGRLRIRGLLVVRGGLGYGPPLPQSSQGSDCGNGWAIGQWWAVYWLGRLLPCGGEMK